MDITFYGQGKVAERCREVLGRLGVGGGMDLLVSVHWPLKFTQLELSKYRLGAVNLHNSYLPWNKGAHACTWAIVDQTPHGATMHWMDEGIDTGPILHQELLDVLDTDTADSLYQKTADLEVKVFEVGMKMLLAGDYAKHQQHEMGTLHKKKDFDRLVRALTTSDCKVIREA